MARQIRRRFGERDLQGGAAPVAPDDPAGAVRPAAPTPAEADPSGETTALSRRAQGDRRRRLGRCLERYHFAWEYKGQRASLDAAFEQLRQYALALENPPLLIVSDMLRRGTPRPARGRCPRGRGP